MDKQAEWRNQNENIPFPLKTRENLPTNIIIDACIFLHTPVVLTRIERVSEYVRIYINDGIYWQALINDKPDYVYNDYGKLVIGDISYYASRPEGYLEDYNIRFEDSVCYPTKEVTLEGLSGDVELIVENEASGHDIALFLPESTTFNYEGVSHINGEFIDNENLQLIGGPCTKVATREGLLTIDDVCLPPCYECNERLTTGDVHLYIKSLEDRLTAIGG